jgi:hypothetical protein
MNNSNDTFKRFDMIAFPEKLDKINNIKELIKTNEKELEDNILSRGIIAKLKSELDKLTDDYNNDLSVKYGYATRSEDGSIVWK